MGLLDALSTPQVSSGLLGLAGGLLSPGTYGNFGLATGKGLLGYQGAENNTQQLGIAKQQADAATGYRDAMTAQTMLAIKRYQDGARMLGGLLGIPQSSSGPSQGSTMPQAPGIPQGNGVTAFPIPAQGSVSQGPSAQSSAQSPTGSNLTQQQRIRAGLDYMFNGGKGIADIIKPNMAFVNGVAVDQNRVQPGFSVPTVNANGMATVTSQNANGTWNVTAPNGAVATYKSFQDAQQASQASHDLVSVVDANGNTRLVPKSSVLGQGGPGSGQAGAGSAPITSRNPADVQYDTDIAKQAANQYTQIQTAGQAAPVKIAEYQQLDSLLSNTNLSKTGFEIANWAAKNGILPASAANSLGNAQAAIALSNRLALTLRSTAEGGGMPGSMSDPDRQFLMQQVPQLETTPEGRRQMIGMLVTVENRNQQVAQMARDWQKSIGRLDKPDIRGKTFSDYLQQWSNARPLFGDLRNGAN